MAPTSLPAQLIHYVFCRCYSKRLDEMLDSIRDRGRFDSEKRIEILRNRFDHISKINDKIQEVEKSLK